MTYAEAQFFNGEPVQHLVDYEIHMADKRRLQVMKRAKR